MESNTFERVRERSNTLGYAAGLALSSIGAGEQ